MFVCCIPDIAQIKRNKTNRVMLLCSVFIQIIGNAKQHRSIEILLLLQKTDAYKEASKFLSVEEKFVFYEFSIRLLVGSFTKYTSEIIATMFLTKT